MIETDTGPRIWNVVVLIIYAHARLAVAIAILLASFCAGARANDFTTAFWVWNRAGLSRAELPELEHCGVSALYYQAGEYTFDGQQWSGESAVITPASTDKLHIVPVIRLVTKGGEPFTGAALSQLFALMAGDIYSHKEMQIDYDCPDRLLGRYAAALVQLHRRVPRLSATALAGWSQSPAWLQLQSSVDELFPMFYDLEPDPVLTGGKLPLPLLDPTTVTRQLQQWRQCQIPWQAGLPTFSRVTLYGPDGHTWGHLRSWNWDDLCFDPALMTTRNTEMGLTLFRANRSGIFENVAIQPGETVAARWPDRAALQSAILAARNAGARGVVFFSLPSPDDPAVWSLAQSTHLDAAARPELKEDGHQTLELINPTEGDLVPRLSGTDSLDRGYAVELDAPAPIFRDALPGDFWRVTAHANPDTTPRPVAIPLATRLTFWFSHLPAHQHLQTGLIELAPGADLGQVRYRIVPGITDWRPVP